MKKSIIATGAASLALAAMPVVGVFAADPADVVDTVRVTIKDSCTFEATQGSTTMAPDSEGEIKRTFAENNATLGTVVTLGGTTNAGAVGTPISVAATCNSDGSGSATTPSWTISVVSDTAMMKTSGTETIPSATAGNEALTSGPTSAWSMRIVAPTTGVTSGWNAWHVMPGATSTNIVTGTPTVSTDTPFTPEYRVYVGTDQASGTYSGTVTYSIVSDFE